MPISNEQILSEVGLSLKQTAAEIAAGVTPTNYAYAPYDVRRYGAKGDGSTNDTAAFTTAGSLGLPIAVPDTGSTYVVTSAVSGVFYAVGLPSINTQFVRLTYLVNAFSDQETLAATAAALEAGTATNIAFFGDSTMWGAQAGPLTQVATPPPTMAVNSINNFFGNSAATAQNNAISGTTLAQMLAGTDGSGQTYKQRLAGTTAPVVYVMHGQNDAYGANSTSAAVFRANLIACIQQTRSAGKSLVLVTPHPALTMGSLGLQARSENVSMFAQIMRDVAAQHGVKLVDIHLRLRQLIQTFVTSAGSQSNNNLPLTVLPDGVHGVQATYTYTGLQLVEALLGDRCENIQVPGQRVLAVRGMVQATGLTFSTSTSSDCSGAAVTGTTSGQTMRLIFRTDVPGLDMSLMTAIYSSGSSNVTVNLDGQLLGGLGMFSCFSSGITSSDFLQDYEIVFARNIAPGFHLLTLNSAGTGAIVINGLRARAVAKPIQLGLSSTDLSVRQLITPKLELPAGGAGNVTAMMDIEGSRFTEALELEWTSQMPKQSGLVICGVHGAVNGAQSVERLLHFYLDASGFATLAEATAIGTYSSTNFSAVDQSTASHTFRVVVTAANPGTVSMFVDGVQVGSAITLTQSYFGGWLGAWKFTAGTDLTITNLSRVWHF
jgi:lysophospholipase L1-like esterase